MPSYLNNGVEQMAAAEHALEGLPEPNRQRYIAAMNALKNKQQSP